MFIVYVVIKPGPDKIFISYVQVHYISLKHLKYLLILQKLLYITEIESLSEKSNHKDEYVIKHMYSKLAQCKKCQVPSNECVTRRLTGVVGVTCPEEMTSNIVQTDCSVFGSYLKAYKWGLVLN